MVDFSNLVCDACGQSGQKKMLRCTRCKSGLYHDASCQKQHWGLHRKTCKTKRWCSFRIATRGCGHGNSLVSSQTIDSNHLVGSFQPLVPPVLNRNCRENNCAWCLGKLTDGLRFTPCDFGASYKLLACSEACDRAVMAPTSLLRYEVGAITSLEQNNLGPPMYLPTALLLYRLMAAVGMGTLSWKDDVKVLARHPDDRRDKREDDDALAHEHAVVQTAHVLLQQSGQLSRYDKSELTAVLERIKVNAVSIEGVAMGLFGVAHFANHSCLPNALQSFVPTVGHLPTLRFTSCQPISVDEEITISYIDESQRWVARQAALRQTYGFDCECVKCLDEKD